jgi:hypothetical protein
MRNPIKQAVISTAEAKYRAALALEQHFSSVLRLRHGGCGATLICHLWNINPQGKGASLWFLVFMHLYTAVGSIPAKVLPFLEQLFQNLFLPCRVQRQEGSLCKGLDIAERLRGSETRQVRALGLGVGLLAGVCKLLPWQGQEA